MAFFSNLKISNCGQKGRIVVASRAFVYTNAILLCKMLVGLCPNPFVLHRTDAGCAFVPNTFITKKIA
jgi:hypothetical protein